MRELAGGQKHSRRRELSGARVALRVRCYEGSRLRDNSNPYTASSRLV
ncbi:MAG: hypothetical protein JWQ07_5597 [Ramlibacter sp.]|nr:hypothetical protein [Ramlibacter sp.]